MRADDSFATAIEIQPGETTGAISPLGDVDYFKFTIGSPQMVTIATKASAVGTPATNLSIFLYDSPGAGHIATSGVPSSFKITKFLQAGTYYARIDGYMPTTGPYRVVLKTQSAATPLTTVVRGNLDVVNDWENYRFTVATPGHVKLWARKPGVSTPAINLEMTLRDEVGNQLKYAWGAATEYSGILNPGNYFVTISSYSSSANTGDFDLKLITPDNAVAIKDGTRSGTIDVPLDHDHYRFVVPGSSPRKIRVCTSGAVDLRLLLQDVTGRYLLPQKGAPSKKHDTEVTLDPGIYFLGMAGVSESGVGAYGNYSLTLSGLVQASPEISIQQPAGSELADGGTKRSFGTATAGGKKGVTKTFTIRNTGGAALTGIKVTKGGKNGGDFKIKSQPATSLAAGKQATFKVTFQPKSKGRKTGWIRVSSNDANENPFDIPVTGQGAVR